MCVWLWHRHGGCWPLLLGRSCHFSCWPSRILAKSKEQMQLFYQIESLSWNNFCLSPVVLLWKGVTWSTLISLHTHRSFSSLGDLLCCVAVCLQPSVRGSKLFHKLYSSWLYLTRFTHTARIYVLWHPNLHDLFCLSLVRIWSDMCISIDSLTERMFNFVFA